MPTYRAVGRAKMVAPIYNEPGYSKLPSISNDRTNISNENVHKISLYNEQPIGYDKL